MGDLSGDRLIALARASDAHSRNTLLLALGDLCAKRSFGLDDAARTAEDVFLRLARDAELAVRAELALRLAATPWAPRAVILHLANDDIEAAEPVLAGSPVLRESDLVDIASRLSAAHRRALARRPGLPSAACEAVASARESDVIRILLANPTAQLEDRALRHCAATAQADPELWDVIVERDGLSEDLVDLAYRAAGSALRATLERRYPQYAELMEGEIGAAVGAALARPPGGPGLSANERLVIELADSGGLDGDFLREAVEDGRLMLFELGLAHLSDCPADVVRRAIDSRAAFGLALAVRAAGLEGRDCARIGAALARSGRLPGGFEAEAKRDCARIYKEYAPDAAREALLRLGAAA